ncbi:hypothetical protein Tco_1245815 [Tanacetum coccineum]
MGNLHGINDAIKVTLFDVITCKSYGGEDTMPLFISFLTLGPIGDWLTFQKRPGPSIPSIFGNFMSNILDWKSEFNFVKQTLIFENRLRHYSFKAQTFPEPILYLVGLASSWEHAPNNHSKLIDGEEMAFHNFMKKPGETSSFSMRLADQPIDVGSPSVDRLKAAVDNDHVESSSVLNDKDVSSLELAIVGEGFSGKNADVAKGSKKRHSITEALEEEDMVVTPVGGDNSSRPMPKKKKLEGQMRTGMRGSVPPLPTTALKGIGKHPRVLARYISNLANSSDSLTPDIEEAYSAHNTLSNLHYHLFKDKLGFLTFDELNLEELSMLKVFAASTEESQKRLSEELEGLKPRAEKVVDLSSKLKAADLEKNELVKDLLPLAGKKLFDSKHFNHALGDLQQKAITFGRSFLLAIPLLFLHVNTKFLNALPPEWSKFVTDVKLAKSLYTTNYDKLYGYLSQHERHVNEVRIMRERNLDPLALVANSQTLYNPSQSPQHSVTQQSQAEIPQLDFGLAVPTFQQGEDSIDCINKEMAFLFVVASRFPPSNNQLKTSSNPGNQATIQDGRVTVQQFQGRQTWSFVGTRNRGIATTSWGNYATGQAKKLMLVEAQVASQILDEAQLAFIADPGIAEVQVAQQIIPQNSAFQTEDLDAYDSDCDDLYLTKAVLMANLSSCDSDVLSEVPYFETYLNDMINQDVQEMPYSEQTHIDDFPDNEITSDSNIIPYSQYLQESQDAGIQDTNSFAPNDLLVLSLVEQMTDHVANLDKENQTNKMVNESLTAKLERYKERVVIFKQ